MKLLYYVYCTYDLDHLLTLKTFKESTKSVFKKQVCFFLNKRRIFSIRVLRYDFQIL